MRFPIQIHHPRRVPGRASVPERGGRNTAAPAAWPGTATGTAHTGTVPAKAAADPFVVEFLAVKALPPRGWRSSPSRGCWSELSG